MAKEPNIVINGKTASPAMAMTIRVAIENFAMDLADTGLGDDEHGKTMTVLYLERISEIRKLMIKQG